MSDKKSSQSKSGGIGLCGAVFLIFLVLKLAEIGQVATWSWWWVTSPLWIPIGLILTFLIGFGIIFVLAAIFSGGVNVTVNKKEDESKKIPISNFQKRLEVMMEERRKNKLNDKK